MRLPSLGVASARLLRKDIARAPGAALRPCPLECSFQ